MVTFSEIMVGMGVGNADVRGFDDMLSLLRSLPTLGQYIRPEGAQGQEDEEERDGTTT